MDLALLGLESLGLVLGLASCFGFIDMVSLALSKQKVPLDIRYLISSAKPK